MLMSSFRAQVRVSVCIVQFRNTAGSGTLSFTHNKEPRTIDLIIIDLKTHIHHVVRYGGHRLQIQLTTCFESIVFNTLRGL